MTAWAVITVLVSWLVTVLPATGPVELDAALGFVLGLIPAGVLAWLLAVSPAWGWVAVPATVGALVAWVLLSWSGLLALAVPFQVGLAVSLGRLLGRQVAEAWWLAAVALLAILADLWSVFLGPTRVVVEEAPRVLDYLLVHFPALGGPSAATGVGMSDFVFIGLYTAGGQAAGLRTRATFIGTTGSLVFTMVFAVLVRPAIPALPLMSLAFIAVNGDLLVQAIRGRFFRGSGGRETGEPGSA